MSDNLYLRVSTIPNYYGLQCFLEILDHLACYELEEMENMIHEFGKKKDASIKWTQPEMWVGDLPEGKSNLLARRIMEDSNGTLNPRYLQSHKRFIQQYELVRVIDDIYTITDAGQLFIKDKNSELTRTIDKLEGIVSILERLVLNGTSKSSDILPAFEAFIETEAEKTLKSSYDYLISRLNNLIARGFINRSGNFYDITTAGRRYLTQLDPENRIQRLQEDAKNKNHEAQKKLQDTLLHMNPFDFEALVAELFRRMGYENVEDIKSTGDDGADVIVEKDFGFGNEKVVIQVKRYKNKIKRDVVSQLRDDISRIGYREADSDDSVSITRGIVVTTSSFTPGAIEVSKKPGEIPINLIDMKQLIRIMIDNELGIKRTAVTYHEFKSDSLQKVLTMPIE